MFYRVLPSFGTKQVRFSSERRPAADADPRSAELPTATPATATVAGPFGGRRRRVSRRFAQIKKERIENVNKKKKKSVGRESLCRHWLSIE